jgi:hypothetical protein
MGTAGRERNGAMTVAANKIATRGQHMGSPLEVLLVFLKLGVSCFGGPIAHIGHFREEFVVRRRWIDERAYVDLAALCQFLPGPASSQVGFSTGLMRAGYRGALAAWTGFTLPLAGESATVFGQHRSSYGWDGIFRRPYRPAANHLGPVKPAASGRGIEYRRHRACPPTEPTAAPSMFPLVTCAPLRPPLCGSPLQGRGAPW